jgi:hypothetical protein
MLTSAKQILKQTSSNEFTPPKYLHKDPSLPADVFLINQRLIAKSKMPQSEPCSQKKKSRKTKTICIPASFMEKFNYKPQRSESWSELKERRSSRERGQTPEITVTNAEVV